MIGFAPIQPDFWMSTAFAAANLNEHCWSEGIRMAIYIVEKVVDGIMLVDLRGNITLGPETEALRSKLRQLLSAGNQRIILNLGEVTYVDSVGLSSLVAGYTSARNAGGDLKLLHLPRGVHQLLQITRLSTVFEIYEDLGTAIESFKSEDM
jgi:anti-sigma B factor antagonist